MKTDYDNAYFEDNVYGHAVALLKRHIGGMMNAAGVHLDLGCGFGRIAEPLTQSTGLTYLGVDLAPESVESLRQRGMEAHVLDLGLGVAEMRLAIGRHLAGRALRSISLIDVLEHIPAPASLLQLVHELMLESGAIFVMSVPNIAHRDVGFKLAFGRFDMRATGILDYTHMRGFTEQGLGAFLAQHGLHVVERNDVLLEHSDQAFPSTHPALADDSLLSSFLRGLRDDVDSTATVNQFVAACLPGPVHAPAHLLMETEIERPAPFLSVVTRTQGRRPSTLRDVLLALAAQSCDDFEVVIVGHKLDHRTQLIVERLIEDTPEYLRRRIRLLRVDRGNRTAPLNEGFTSARGDYVAILDDDDLPMAHWVETFKSLALQKPGSLLRAVAVRQEFDEVLTHSAATASARSMSGFQKEYPSAFDWFEHLRVNQTPPIAMAVPRSVFADLKIRFDETLTTTEDWDFLMRVAAVCGVASTPAITCIYRWWTEAESSRSVHSLEEWQTNHIRIYDKLDRMPVLLPAGSTKTIRDLLDERDRLRAEVHQLHVYADAEARTRGEALPVVGPIQGLSTSQHALMLAVGSRSWRLSAPLRYLSSTLGSRPRAVLDINALSDEEALQTLAAVHASTSWRLTSPLRWVKSWVS